MSKINRREFLISTAPLLGLPMLLPMLAGDVSAAEMQAGWRFCTKCSSLFWGGGVPDKAGCAAGGPHDRAGFIFHLPYNVPATPKAQSDWRFCDKCFGLFFNGYPDKGRCSGGGAHRMYGFDYVIPHDIAPNANSQDKWRFCSKCKAMFYDGYPAKGRCPAGAGHAAAGFGFVLPHDLQPEFSLGARLNTDGWAPINGNMNIVAKPNGECVFSGRIHNSGAINIRFSLYAVVASSAGAFAFSVENKRVDGTEVLFGRDRDFSWNQAGSSPVIAQKWAEFSKSQLSTRLVASSAVGSGLTSMLRTMAREAYLRTPSDIRAFDSIADYPVARLISIL